jgi:16S rRNA (cytosine1402-N4)-methyltransferase
MKREVIDGLEPHAGGLYVDATLGGGGHAEAILEFSGTNVIGVDRDASAIELAKIRLARFGARATFVQSRFGALIEVLAALGTTAVDGIVADVGLSSMQLDDASRGMSFRAEGPLDMRMDPGSGETALDLIDQSSDDELADLIYRFGEERRSRRVARCIKQARAAGELWTTLDLRRAVVRAVGPARIGGVDPATRTFQALRIAVNGELDELRALLESAAHLIVPGGRLVVVSFHSLEDRLVKRAMRDRSTWEPLSKKPIVATEAETIDNPRARSAKLRSARRLPPGAPGLSIVRYDDDDGSGPPSAGGGE